MNKVWETGNITKDLTLKYTQQGTAVLSFDIAVPRKMKKDETDFFSIEAWSKTAEFISQYFGKGRKISVCGRLENRSWEDNEGKKHYKNVIVVEEVDFADSKKEGQPSGQQGEGMPDLDPDELPFN